MGPRYNGSFISFSFLEVWGIFRSISLVRRIAIVSLNIILGHFRVFCLLGRTKTSLVSCLTVKVTFNSCDQLSTHQSSFAVEKNVKSLVILLGTPARSQIDDCLFIVTEQPLV